MKYPLASLFLLFTLTGSINAFAAETEAPPINDERADAPLDQEAATDPLDETSEGDIAAEVENEAENEEATGAGTLDTAEASVPRDPNEPFVPSIQISEDLSVSFPVDI